MKLSLNIPSPSLEPSSGSNGSRGAADGAQDGGSEFPSYDRPQTRRAVLRSTLASGLLIAVWPAVQATEGELAAAISAFTGGAAAAVGKVQLEIAQLIENGNSVPVTVNVESLMTPADHVTSIAIFNELNPQRDVAVFTLGPRAGRARIATRIRLATSQRLVAVARLSDGTYWQHSVEVVVTLAACAET